MHGLLGIFRVQLPVARSHIDDDIRRLVEEVKVLSDQFRQLVADESQVVDSQKADSDKVADLQQKIIDRRAELEQLRQTVAGRPVMMRGTRSILGARNARIAAL